MESADPSPAQAVVFGPEADGFEGVLGLLSERSLAVTITLVTGEAFGAVLVSAENGTLIYERWDEAAGVPGCELRTLAVDRIAEVKVT